MLGNFNSKLKLSVKTLILVYTISTKLVDVSCKRSKYDHLNV